MSEMSGFDTIVDEFAEKIFNHAYRMLGSREDAEEATQDVFLKIYQGLSNFRGESRISTWIWRITTNVCLSRRARNKLSTELLDENDEQASGIKNDNHQNPEELFIADEACAELGQLIAALSPQEASAITLFYLEGMDYAEIARIMDVPMGTVATALHRGRKRLRALFLRKEKVQ